MAEIIDEFMNWRSQFVTSNSDRMGLRHAPPDRPRKQIGFHVREKSAAYHASGKGKRRHA